MTYEGGKDGINASSACSSGQLPWYAKANLDEMRTMRENHNILLANSIFPVISMNFLYLGDDFVDAGRDIFHTLATRTPTYFSGSTMWRDDSAKSGISFFRFDTE